MKTSLLTLSAVLLLAAPAFAQKVPTAQVPAAAQATFTAKFSGATAVKWEKEGAGYEVNFKQASREMSAVLTPGGELTETETELKAASLPAAVRATLARDYKTAKVGEAARIVRANGSTVYEAEISQGGKKQDVLFTADGKVTQ